MAKPVEFEDSAEATDFMETLQGMLEDPRLMNWAKITDTNYGTRSTVALVEAVGNYAEFIETMYSAE